MNGNPSAEQKKTPGDGRGFSQGLNNGSQTNDRTNSITPSARELWSGYHRVDSHPVTDQYQLPPSLCARLTEAGDLAVAIVDEPMGYCSNLMVCRSDGRYRYLHEIKPGEFTPCTDFIDVEKVVVGESYLSSLALSVKYPEAYVCCAHDDINLASVIENLAGRWPHVEYIAAPDTERVDVSDNVKIIRPPGSVTWLAAHLIGNTIREAA